MSMPIITPSTTTREQAITDMVESVALQQTGISHILNAEGEKLQAVVAMATTSDQLLKVNKSVNCMVNSISMLEMVLQSKLSLFSHCLCHPCPPTSITVNLTQETPNPLVTITNTNPTTFQVLLKGVTTKENLLIATTPTLQPITSLFLGSNVTLTGNVLSWIPTEDTTTSSAILSIGEGNGKQVITIHFQSTPKK